MKDGVVLKKKEFETALPAVLMNIDRKKKIGEGRRTSQWVLSSLLFKKVSISE